ncbi:MAG: molybdopterin-guanine dinucleotide biosynthesis protein B [Candidatus Korarchaeota archaeon]|nr:molybdopterin-guanine dinucleotide biosynthesis protein B [Candidatus Korarchaeota archaeon]NIU85357.1 molybdopterin-guanine dinucleotide biosynthesis protein B [Candidatus Thorarchaeota archaeon]NIW15455.1 molybdopterin-guanine dinucleotide biosynthesis protein B [Candidatus Thorarchaeota archaeon]NIW53399.1 molybdopterin-guanine dinucleotide biosynthesis protein B [Candidatus Korarchaeota archaeon]
MNVGTEQPPVFGVSGPSGSGKTKLMEYLIEKLNEKGYKVATIKHTRGKFSLDEEGKDTWRHRKAGSTLAVFSSPIETAYIEEKIDKLDRIIRTLPRLGSFDIILVEGFHESEIPKIAVGKGKRTRTAKNVVLHYEDNKEEVLELLIEAIQTHHITKKLPGLNCGDCGLNSCQELAKAILNGERTLNDCKNLAASRINLWVNGEPIPLSGFPSRMIRDTVIGMLNSLKGVEHLENLVLEIKSQD